MSAAILDAPPRYVLGMDEVEYHAHSALSASQAKVLLTSPKHYQASLHVRVEKKEFDEGHAVHGLVLGTGMDVGEIPHDLLSSDGGIRSNAAKAAVADIRAAGKVPLKPDVFARVKGAAEAVLAHPKARRYLERPGDSEVSMFATDPEIGIRLRGRADRVTDDPDTEQPIIVDVKTARAIDLRSLVRAVIDLRYDLSMEMYRFLYELTKGVVPGQSVLIFTEKLAPYDVRVVRLGDAWIEGGWRTLREAIEKYRDCIEAGVWPGVDEGDGPIDDLAAPPWYIGSQLDLAGGRL